MYGTRDAASNWERDWQEHVKNWGFQMGPSSKKTCFTTENRVSGLTHGDDFVLTGPTKKLMEFERKTTSIHPIKAKIISYGSPKSIQTLNRRLHWGKRGIVCQLCRSQVARCLFLSQDQADITFIVNEFARRCRVPTSRVLPN